ncbi:MAG: hypothetical protein AAGE52_09580 [Myxococcota bacterium]
MNDDELMKALGKRALERDDSWDEFAKGGPEPEVEGDAEDHETLRALYEPIDPLVRARIASQLPAPRRRWPVAAATLVVAAAAVLFLVLPGTTLPPYQVELSEGTALERGEPAAAGRYRASDQLEIVLRPDENVEGAVHVVVFDNGVRWTGTPEVAPSGAIRIAGTAGSLFDVGTHRLVFAVTADESPTSVDEISGTPLEVTLEVEP